METYFTNSCAHGPSYQNQRDNARTPCSMDHECAIIKNMNVHDTEWAYYAVPLMVLALSIHNEKERKIVMRKVMNRVLVVGIVLTVVYLFWEYYKPLRVKKIWKAGVWRETAEGRKRRGNADCRAIYNYARKPSLTNSWKMMNKKCIKIGLWSP